MGRETRRRRVVPPPRARGVPAVERLCRARLGCRGDAGRVGRARAARRRVATHRLGLPDRGREHHARGAASGPLPEPAADQRRARQWQKDGARLRLLVELRDQGYPGSNYELDYDAAHDTLFGTYHHLGLNQDFQVSFYRLGKEGAGS